MRISQFVLSSALWIALTECSVNLADVKCGQAPDGNTRGGRVVGGGPADIRDFPHAVSITRNDKHHCAGSIVSEKIGEN